jgi:hypothetical protein
MMIVLVLGRFRKNRVYAIPMGLHHWQCRDGGAQYKKKTKRKRFTTVKNCSEKHQFDK